MRPSLAAALAATVVLVLAIPVGRPETSGPPAAPAVVDQPATPTQPTPASSPPSMIGIARRAMRWQLDAEAGRDKSLPPRTFTTDLERQLTERPPRPAPGRPTAHVVRVRETQPVPGARRVLVTVERGTERSQVTVIVLCRRRCLVASVE